LNGQVKLAIWKRICRKGGSVIIVRSHDVQELFASNIIAPSSEGGKLRSQQYALVVRFKLQWNFVIKSLVGINYREGLNVGLDIPKLSKFHEVDVLVMLVRRVEPSLLSEHGVVDVLLEHDIFLVCMDRNHGEKSKLTHLEIAVRVYGFCGKASPGVDRGITVVRQTGDARPGKCGDIEIGSN
jgi:hypothetical protein